MTRPPSRQSGSSSRRTASQSRTQTRSPGIPRRWGLVGRVVPGLPRARYQVLHRPDAEGHDGLAALLRALHEHRDAWRARRSVAAAGPSA